MTWDINAPQCDEAAKIRWSLVPYMRGRMLDIGCGKFKVFPHAIGCDNGHHWGMSGSDVKTEATDLSLFSSQSCDCIFSSHLLEHIEYEKVPDTLKEWFRVLKRGGHLCLYLPADDAYPKVGERGANPDHKWNCQYDNVVAALETLESSWDMLEYEHRIETNEYSHWFVVRRL